MFSFLTMSILFNLHNKFMKLLSIRSLEFARIFASIAKQIKDATNFRKRFTHPKAHNFKAKNIERSQRRFAMTYLFSDIYTYILLPHKSPELIFRTSVSLSIGTLS